MKDGDETENTKLLRELVEAFVQHPRSVQVKTLRQPDDGELMTVKVHGADQPRVFGGQGKHIQALRTIFQFIGARDERRIRLILIEPRERSANVPPAAFKANRDWEPSQTKALLGRVLSRVLAKPAKIDVYSSDDTTMIDIYADKSEQELCDGLTEYLKPIFHAIGKNQGRELFLESKKTIEINKPGKNANE